MTPEMQSFLLGVEDGEIPVMFTDGQEPHYYLKGIITQCDEWITEGWGCDNNSITPAMYAAALLNEAKTQDTCVQNKESHPDYPKALRQLACFILKNDGHGEYNPVTRSFKFK